MSEHLKAAREILQEVGAPFFIEARVSRQYRAIDCILAHLEAQEEVTEANLKDILATEKSLQSRLQDLTRRIEILEAEQTVWECKDCKREYETERRYAFAYCPYCHGGNVRRAVGTGQPVIAERVREIMREEIAAAAEREQADAHDAEVEYEQRRQEEQQASRKAIKDAAANINQAFAERDILRRKLEIAEDGLRAISRMSVNRTWEVHRVNLTLDAIAQIDAPANGSAPLG